MNAPSMRPDDLEGLATDMASVVAHASVDDEHLHLARADGGRRIVNALWRHVDADDRPS